MEGYAPEAWSQIISTAAVSPLGIASLMILIVGFVVLALIKRADKPLMRFGVIILLMLFSGGLLGAAVYSVRPTAASSAVAKGGGESTSAPEPAPPPPPVKPATETSPAIKAAETMKLAEARRDCGAAWTGWVEPGGGVGNPCPAGCDRGDELGQSYRAVGFPPRPQTRHKFQCWRHP